VLVGRRRPVKYGGRNPNMFRPRRKTTSMRPVPATGWSSSNITDRRDGLWEDDIEEVPF